LKNEKDPLAAALIGFASLLKNRKLKMAGRDVVVEDTADWDPLLNMGRLHPELINCLVPSGDPKQTRTLVDLLASRNQRMTIVRDAKNGEILSVSFVKVRKDANGNPALHLERPSGRRGAKFEDLMIDHIVQKSLKMGSAGQNATITRQARTKKEREAGITLFSTGSAATHEYIEDLYGVRKSANVQFNAHVVHRNTVTGGGGSGLPPHRPVQRFVPMTFGAGMYAGMGGMMISTPISPVGVLK